MIANRCELILDSFTEFDENMTPEQLCTYLLSKQMPEEDCKVMQGKLAHQNTSLLKISSNTENAIGGLLFLNLTDMNWKKFGISEVGMLYIKCIKGVDKIL